MRLFSKVWMWFYVVLGVALFSFGLFTTRPNVSIHLVQHLMVVTLWPLFAFVVAGVLLLTGVCLRWRTQQYGVSLAIIFSLAGVAFILLAGSSVASNWKTLVQRFSDDAADEQRLASLQKADLSTTTPRLQASPGDWPQWRGPARDGKSAETGINTDWTKTPPKELWRRKIGGGYSSLSVVGDRIYTMDRQGNDERIVCLAAADGNELWSVSYPVDFNRFQYNSGPRATPTIVEGRLYAVGSTGIFLALDLPSDAQGQPRELWRHDLIAEFDAALEKWGMACSPAVDGDLVVVQPGGSKGSVAAFHRITGQLAWAALADSNGYSSPMIADLAGERQVVAFTGEGVAGLSLKNGQQRWYFDWPEQFHGNIATPIVAGNFTFISSAYDNGGCALLEIVKQDGDWEAKLVYKKRNKLMSNHHSTCVLHEGHLYGFDRSIFKCIDLRTGAEKWYSRRPEKGCLTYADGHLIILSEKGELSLAEASPTKCTLKGKLELFDRAETWAVPVLSRGRLYVRDNAEIVCVDLKAPVVQ